MNCPSVCHSPKKAELFDRLASIFGTSIAYISVSKPTSWAPRGQLASNTHYAVYVYM